MPGEPVVLVGGRDGRIRSFVAALSRFPAEPQWAVVGGFAVYARITRDRSAVDSSARLRAGHVHRVTNDLDTVSRNQPSLVEILVAEPDADRLAAAKLQLNQDGAAVVVDVMDDTSDAPLPTEPGDHAFALARRMALATSEETELVVVEDEAVVARTSAPVATASSLIALKAVAIPHRAQSNHPAKVGSDIHDLVRLVQSCDFDETIDSIAEAGAELRDWVGTTLVKWFSPDQDLGYTFARLRQLARSPDAAALIEVDLEVVAQLGHELLS